MVRLMTRALGDLRQAALLGVFLLGASAGGCASLAQGLPPRLNLPEGFTWEAKVAVETKCTTAYHPDDKVDYRRERAVGFLCCVKEKCSDTSMKIEFRYNWLRDSTTGWDATPYDSAIPYSPWGWGYRKRALDALLGRSFVAEVTAEGKVRKLADFEDFYRSFHDVLTYIEPPPANLVVGNKEAHMRFRKEMAEESFQEFFSDYWPLSEEVLRQTVQEFFVIWPRPGEEKGQSWHTEETIPALALRRDNAWTLKEKTQERIAIELLSQVRTDLSLCNSSTPNEYYKGSGDSLIGACYRYQKWQYPTSYMGQRKGGFYVDPKLGLIRAATWNEELSGTVQLKDLRKSKPELITCPTERTCSVTIQITPGN
jgi:hypothetical protein